MRDKQVEAFYQFEWSAKTAKAYLQSLADTNDIINSYRSKPYPGWLPLRVRGENPLFLGIELEIEVKRPFTFVDLFKVNKNYKIPVWLKHDGSLSGDGVELVFPPLTRGARKALNLYDYLKAVRNIATSYDNGRCGLHVHISFPSARICDRFIILGFSIIRFIRRFSRRNDSQWGQWCCHWSLEEKEQLQNSERYRFINRYRRTRVEIRAFRGTLWYPRISATLQLISAMVRFVLDETREGLFRAAYRENIYKPLYGDGNEAKRRLWEDFFSFVEREYQNLYQYCLEQKLL